MGAIAIFQDIVIVLVVVRQRALMRDLTKEYVLELFVAVSIIEINHIII